LREFLKNLKEQSEKLRDPEEMAKLERSMYSVAASYPVEIPGSLAGSA